jgi:hypothetical protein
MGLVFWFFAAPDPRFARALLFLVPTAGVTILLYETRGIRLPGANPALALALVFIAFQPNINFLWLNLGPHQFPQAGRQGPVQPPYRERTTDSGLKVFLPEKGDQMWDSPIPSAPYFNPKLRLREPGNLASGFVADAPVPWYPATILDKVRVVFSDLSPTP